MMEHLRLKSTNQTIRPDGPSCIGFCILKCVILISLTKVGTSADCVLLHPPPRQLWFGSEERHGSLLVVAIPVDKREMVCLNKVVCNE